MDKHSISEFDLIAYADGQYRFDPSRRTAVERALDQDPVLRDKARTYRQQNEALREAYDPWIEKPVPDRLYEVLSFDRAARWRQPAAAAAVVFLIVAAGAGGWWAGRMQATGDGWPVGALLARGGTDTDMEPAKAGRDREPILRADGAQSLNWLSDEIMMPLRTPDLSKFGFSLAAANTVRLEGSKAVRLLYIGQDGTDVTVYLRPQWENRSGALKVSGSGRLSVAIWRDGPVSTAMVSHLPPERTRAIAEAIRSEMRAQRDRGATAGLSGGTTGPGAASILENDGLVKRETLEPAKALADEAPSSPLSNELGAPEQR